MASICLWPTWERPQRKRSQSCPAARRDGTDVPGRREPHQHLPAGRAGEQLPLRASDILRGARRRLGAESGALCSRGRRCPVLCRCRAPRAPLKGRSHSWARGGPIGGGGAGSGRRARDAQRSETAFHREAAAGRGRGRVPSRAPGGARRQRTCRKRRLGAPRERCRRRSSFYGESRRPNGRPPLLGPGRRSGRRSGRRPDRERGAAGHAARRQPLWKRLRSEPRRGDSGAPALRCRHAAAPGARAAASRPNLDPRGSSAPLLRHADMGTARKPRQLSPHSPNGEKGGGWDPPCLYRGELCVRWATPSCGWGAGC